MLSLTLYSQAVLDAGFSGFWLQGFAQNITLRGNRIERPGFCGVFLQGIYPGDTTSDSVGAIAGGPIDSAAKSDVNKGHLIADNSIHDYGRRVGHGSGLWFFQAGRTRVTHNQVVEGPPCPNQTKPNQTKPNQTRVRSGPRAASRS